MCLFFQKGIGKSCNPLLFVSCCDNFWIIIAYNSSEMKIKNVLFHENIPWYLSLNVICLLENMTKRRAQRSKDDFELDDGRIILLGEMKVQISSFLAHLSVQCPLNVVRNGAADKGYIHSDICTSLSQMPLWTFHSLCCCAHSLVSLAGLSPNF